MLSASHTDMSDYGPYSAIPRPAHKRPFASVAGFQTLTKILSHEYIWSESLGCYITPGNASGPGSVNTERKEEEEAAGSAVKKQKIGMESA